MADSQNDAMIARLEGELEERNAFIQGTIASAEDAARDLTDSERELITSAKGRIDAIKGQLHLDPPKPVIYPAPTAKTRVAAQILAAPESIQAAPVPEPASLLVFAAALAVAALRARGGFGQRA